MTADNREISRRLFEGVWNSREFHLIDELMHPEYVHHDPQAPGGATKGPEEYKQFAKLYVNAFPDVRITIEDEISSGDTVVTRWTASGTHQGDLPGLPRTGKRVTVSGITIARLRNGKIIESWNLWDALGMTRQLGVVPAEERSPAA